MKNTFYTDFDTERLTEEGITNDHRTPFQVDRDRILYTSSFRNLQSKTQVFFSGEYDFYRTRLTHSLEVAQVGRSITDWLRVSSPYLSEEYYIDADLVEAACLTHDLGHPPFGHAGEHVINAMMREWGGFEGNAQTLRLITERIFAERQTGMNPTRAFLDSILKYKTLWSELGGSNSPPTNHFLYDQQTSYLDWVMDQRDFPAEYHPGPARDAFQSLECQIMDWADDTAYSLNDLADSTRAGFLTTLKVEQWAEQQTLSTVEQEAIEALLRAMRRHSLDAFVGSRIGKWIRSTALVQDSNCLSALSNRYQYRLTVSQAVKQACSIYKKLSFEVVFQHTGLKQLEYRGKQMLETLWHTFQSQCIQSNSNPHLLPPLERSELHSKSCQRTQHRLLSDYFASLTDLSTKKLYLRLYDPNAGSFTDLLS